MSQRPRRDIHSGDVFQALHLAQQSGHRPRLRRSPGRSRAARAGSSPRTAATTASTRRSFRRTGFLEGLPLLSSARSGRRLGRVGVGQSLDIRQTLQRGVGERASVAQVAPRDQRFVGMRPQPVASAPHQFIHLVLADRVMLGVVEHGNQHVQVGQQIAHGLLARDRDRVAVARAPSGKAGVQKFVARDRRRV